jgi:hypothetical protein
MHDIDRAVDGAVWMSIHGPSSIVVASLIRRRATERKKANESERKREMMRVMSGQRICPKRAIVLTFVMTFLQLKLAGLTANGGWGG